MGLNLLWPLVGGSYVAVQLVRERNAYWAEERVIEAQASEFCARWARAARAGAPLPRPPQPLGYFVADLVPSPALDRVSGKLMIVGSWGRGTPGAVIGFADGTARFVARYEIADVCRADAEARRELGLDRGPVFSF